MMCTFSTSRVIYGSKLDLFGTKVVGMGKGQVFITVDV